VGHHTRTVQDKDVQQGDYTASTVAGPLSVSSHSERYLVWGNLNSEVVQEFATGPNTVERAGYLTEQEVGLLDALKEPIVVLDEAFVLHELLLLFSAGEVKAHL
jgi:hypothetical protein